MLSKVSKKNVSSPDGDTDFFDIVDVLQGQTFAPYLFIIILENLLRTSIYLMKENGCKLKKKKQDADVTLHKLLPTKAT